jgi:antitoxin VapB
MVSKRFTEKDLLKGLDENNSHADELAEPLPQELEPLERLRGSVKRYIRPTDPVWDDAGVADDFMEDRELPPPAQDNDL